MRAHYAHRDYVRYTDTLDDSDDDEGPTNDDAWLYEDLTILAKLYSRLKDREQLIALIFEVCIFVLFFPQLAGLSPCGLNLLRDLFLFGEVEDDAFNDVSEFQ